MHAALPAALALTVASLAVPASGQVAQPDLVLWVDWLPEERLPANESRMSMLHVHLDCNMPGRLPDGLLKLEYISTRDVQLQGVSETTVRSMVCPGSAVLDLPIYITAWGVPRDGTDEVWVAGHLDFSDPVSPDVAAEPFALQVQVVPEQADLGPTNVVYPAPRRVELGAADGTEAVAGLGILAASLLGYGEYRRRRD